jgi:FtsP/CotA-like multicopper oxidase with cupredoxin domain
VQEGLPGITLLEDMSFIDTPPPGKDTSQEGCPGNDLKYQPGFLLPPGKRMELLVRFDKSTAPGTYKLVTRGLATNPFQVEYGREIANVVVEGDPVSDMVVPDKLLPPEAFGLADLRAKSPASTHCLAFGIVPPATPGLPDFVINDQNFCAAKPMAEGKDQTPLCTTLGDTDQWDIVNTTADTHPFHIHVNPFQVTQMNGVQISPPECSPAVLEDTVSLPVAQDPTNPPAAECNDSTLQTAGFSFRTTYTDFAGDPVFHCHILLHEDGSMMGRFTITEP